MKNDLCYEVRCIILPEFFDMCVQKTGAFLKYVQLFQMTLFLAGSVPTLQMKTFTKHITMYQSQSNANEHVIK